MKRETIIARTLRDYQCATVIDPEFAASLVEDQGQTAFDDLLQRRQHDASVILSELDRRLTEHVYLTCADFIHFDVNCCENCHTGYPHYDMYVVSLDDGRHAWVCCPVQCVLMREIRRSSGPEREASLKLFDLFGCSPDPIEERLHIANLAAGTDEERLRYCLMYVHHVYGRERGHKKLDTLVSRALGLPGRGPARGCKVAGAQSISSQ